MAFTEIHRAVQDRASLLTSKSARGTLFACTRWLRTSAQRLLEVSCENRVQKTVLRGFRELELWCIVSPRVPPYGFTPAAAVIGRYNTRRQLFVGDAQANQTIRLNFRREDHNNDWPGPTNMAVRSTVRPRLSSSDSSSSQSTGCLT